MKLIARLNEKSTRTWKEQCLKDISFLEHAAFTIAYDPYVVYGMKFRHYDITNLGEPSREMFDLLRTVANKELTGGAATLAVEDFAEANGDLIKLMINKDLRCGVTATTLNKVHPGSVAKFKVQLATAVPVEKLNFPVFAQIKYDGVRLIILNNQGHVTFRTRNGKTVNLPNIQAQLEAGPDQDYIIDCEAVYSEGKSDDRTSISGAINSAMHGGEIDESEIVLAAFDTMSAADWYRGICNTTYNDRLINLSNRLARIKANSVVAAPTHLVSQAEHANEMYAEAIADGYEGLILKQPAHLYSFKRSKDWAKLKEVKTADLTCKMCVTGGGKYIGKIGALSLVGKVEDKDIVVNVGSGLTDEDRAKSCEDFIDKVIEIKYNSIIQDSKTKKWSLFLPRFVCIRHDR